MDLNVDERSISLAPLEGVAGVTVLLEETIGSSAIGEQDHHLVDRLRVLTEVVLHDKTIRINHNNKGSIDIPRRHQGP